MVDADTVGYQGMTWLYIQACKNLGVADPNYGFILKMLICGIPCRSVHSLNQQWHNLHRISLDPSRNYKL